MSEPPNTPSSIIHHNHQHQHQHHQQAPQQYYHHHLPHHQPPPPQQQPYISPIPSPCPSPSPSSSLVREYRKGNWTLHETLVLITAKKLDDERRTTKSSSSSTPTTSSTTPPDNKNQLQQQTPSSSTRTAELRWKWVENYCWNNGCLRSQNQCNDKWDNLLRDYKKVREYDSRSSSTNDLQSYWKLEKHERKERNLPTNLLLEVFEALNEVVHRRYATPKTSPAPLPPPPPPPLAAAALPPPPRPPQTFSGETTESSESNQTERVDSNMKRRRKLKNVGSSVLKSASVLAQTLINCEEKKEKRHKDIIELEQRKLQIEETRNEVNREGIAGLISAVNNLSGAIQAFVSDRHHNSGSS